MAEAPQWADPPYRVLTLQGITVNKELPVYNTRRFAFCDRCVFMCSVVHIYVPALFSSARLNTTREPNLLKLICL